MSEWRTSKKKSSSKKKGSKAATSKKSASGEKKASSKKATKKKTAASKKATAKKTSSKKKAASSKTTSGKTKAASSETAAKTVSSSKKKTATKKTSSKKTATKKTSSKKAAAKKTSSKKKTSAKKQTSNKRTSAKKTSRSKADAPVGLRLVPPPEDSLPANVLPLFPDFVPDHEWVMGVLTAEDPKDGCAVLFMEAGTKTVLHLEVLRQMRSRALGRSFREATAHADAHGRKAPTRLRVAVPEHAALLERADLGVSVVVGPVPELEGLQGEMAGFDASGPGLAEEHDRYRSATDITDDHLMTFFEAAIGFRSTKPWHALSFEVPLLFEVPELGIEHGALSVMGIGAQGGVILVPDVAAVPDDEVSAGAEPMDMPPQSLAVIFAERDELSDARAAELRSMAYAPDSGPCPVLLAIDAEQRSRSATGRDYELAIAAMLAIDAFVSDYSPVLECSSLRSLMACYPMRLGDRPRVDVHLGLPELGDPPEPTDDQPPYEAVFELPPLIEPAHACRLRISLRGIKPPVWRRVEVPSDITLAKLHDVIQAVMGWDDCHLHQFDVGGEPFGPVSDDPFGHEVGDEATVTLGDLAAEGHTFEYTYDFGDHWVHRVKVEKVYALERPLERPLCTGGKRACPPEDCGGVPGYQHALEQLSAGAGNELPEHLMAFSGFDPAEFDAKEADAVLGQVFEKT